MYFCSCYCLHSNFLTPKKFYWRSIWWHMILYVLRWPFLSAAYHYILRLIENNVIEELNIGIHSYEHDFVLLQRRIIANDGTNSFTKILVYTYTLRNSMSHDGSVKSFVFEALNFYLKMAYSYMTILVRWRKNTEHKSNVMK